MREEKISLEEIDKIIGTIGFNTFMCQEKGWTNGESFSMLLSKIREYIIEFKNSKYNTKEGSKQCLPKLKQSKKRKVMKSIRRWSCR